MSNLHGDLSFLSATANSPVHQAFDFSTHSRRAVSPLFEHSHCRARNFAAHYQLDPRADGARKAKRKLRRREVFLRDARSESGAMYLRHASARERFFIKPFKDILEFARCPIRRDAVRTL